MVEDRRMELAHEAFQKQNWREAYDCFQNASLGAELTAPDLELFGSSAYLTARDDEASSLWARSHNAFVDQGDLARAARLGFFLSLTFLLRGEMPRSSGWLARSQRLLETIDDQAAEHGFCNLLIGLRKLFGGDPEDALEIIDKTVTLAGRCGDRDLLALSLLGRGQTLIALRRASEGQSCLDEAMVCVTSGSVTPILCGVIYCAVILTCQSIFDVERAREWTSEFNAWCQPQPDLIPFRGQCLIHRSEILQMRGEWPAAMQEADQACRWLKDRSEATVGRAQYQKGEMHRLIGEFDLADKSYRMAAVYGIDPLPGRALLRLQQGQFDEAVASIQEACGPGFGIPESVGKSDRLKLLGPSVEILLRAGDVDTAIAAANELSAWKETFPAPLLVATSAYADGFIRAANGETEPALAELKKSLTLWQQLGMPYEVARVRVRLADLHHKLGDVDLAATHGEAARETFLRLGAGPDLRGLESLAWNSGGVGNSGFTSRQMQVLRLLADGRSNREIAVELGISEHTVARHVSNIFDKSGVSSRTAAIAYAHRKNLLS